ncbi:hypothetical protein [Clostridium felsineum]|uniref:Uncharacterized protein n=1 Tax=Clostridium felsineum TaxID=36839 RepID=A0A1S8MHN1_9CLOT|nr:hypothetical protein [Clostridium felsineum]URZ00295.1 hypothetical protein CLAUR_002830 [Clostridium felsineum]URZ07067.1 hypothetical protein CLROS_024000 [Clostridium felsineum]URZ12097.1 hypothetical protein CROST_028140 [Clostridium felsineum]
MKIYLNVKQAGSRKNYIAKEEIILEVVPNTLRELIEQVITQNVKDFNDNLKKEKLVEYLTDKEIQEKAELGKIAFGNMYNDTKQNLSKALQNAFVSFEDGIYKVFINDNETEKLDTPIGLRDGDILTFIKFIMLSGRLW